MKVIQCIIIEDEEATRQLLRTMLEKYCEGIAVVGEAGTVQEGVALIKATTPDLVFLDIALPKESGFSLYKYFDEITFQVVFTTAYSQYAIKAIKMAALDYLVKPINLEELMETLERFRNQTAIPNTKSNYQLIEENSKQGAAHQKLALACAEGYIFVPIKDIIRCQSEKSYTLFIIKDQEPIWTSKNLGEYTGILEEHGFKRVHRSHLINPAFVSKFIRGKQPTLVMDDGTEISVSANRKNDLLKNFFIP